MFRCSEASALVRHSSARWRRGKSLAQPLKQSVHGEVQIESLPMKTLAITNEPPSRALACRRI
jgi:hypothetical protein